MDEPKNVIEAAIKQLKQERANLDALIAALEKWAVGGPTVPLASLLHAGSPTGSTEVFRGEFYGLSITKAAEKLLKRVKHPLKTPEIMESFQRAGYEVKGKTPRASIYTSLKRSKDFVKVLPDTWDLAALHPEAAAFKESESAKVKKPRMTRARRAAAPEAVSTAKTAAVA